MYTFVTGGYRSGRSSYALKRASELGPPPWLYVSTAGETDESVHKRIQRHRRDAEAIWRTAVMPARPCDLLDGPTLHGLGAAVIDGFPGWLESELAATRPGQDSALLGEVARFAERLYRCRVPLVVVSTEMSMSPLPGDETQLRLVRVMTSANQILAEQAGAMVLMVSGVPLRVR
jgi:adenosylcobinamide kinase/adenosylcobinamide-phosphate guanylyltransferase